jgi:CO/xanthine dehydrogenase Mo-binding subunit
MRMELTRRTVIAGGLGLAGAGLVLSLADDNSAARLPGVPTDVLQPNAYLQITPAGQIILQVDKLEMGQGVMTGFVTLLAEELGVRPDQIQPRHAPVHPHFQTPMQVTAESASMRYRWEPIRLTGAAAREMLREAAALRWGISAAQVSVSGDGELINLNNEKRLAYGELAAAAAVLPVPEQPALTAPADFRWIGRTTPRPDIPDKVTGDAIFGTDVRLPGMLTAMLLRPPRFGDSLIKVATDAAVAVPGVRQVFQVSGGVAVVAEGFWPARQGIQKLQAEWQPGPMAEFSMAGFYEAQRKELESGSGKQARDEGDVEAAIATSAQVIEAEYTTPFLSHMPMETMNATVRLTADRCEFWAPVQAPDLARQAACDLTGLTRAQVQVNTTFAGGSFGRRALMDFISEAVAIALQVDAPIQLIWTREDELRHDFYRSATLHRLQGGLDADGSLVAWDHALVGPDLSEHILSKAFANLAPEWVSRAVTNGAANTMRRAQMAFFGPFQTRDGSVSWPYRAINVRVSLHTLNPALPVGIWRSVGNSYNVFAVESFMDELAEQAGADPAAFRRRQLADRPRYLAVLDRLLRESGWGAAASGRHQGIAIHDCFDSVIGQVAEVSVRGDRITVHRVSCVVDCGTAINPDNVHAQLQGAIIFGLNAALNGELKLAEGFVQQSNFHDYPMLRLADTPVIDTYIIDSAAPPAGIGETGTPGIAPAVANAIFAATGRRLRHLPLRLT